LSGVNDLAARGVVLGIGREAEHHVEQQPDRIALQLHVPFLHDVEEADLDLGREVGQLVDGEDAAVGAREQAEVHGQLVRQQVSAARGLDRVDVADDVRDGDVGRRELLDETLVAREPGDRRPVSHLRDALAGELGERPEGIVIDLAPGDDRDLLVEQAREGPEDPGLRLAAQAEQDEIVPREERVHDAWYDGVFVAVNAGKQVVAALEGRDQVGANFIADRPGGERCFAPGTVPEITECCWIVFHR
jgi:hypothetical protein